MNQGPITRFEISIAQISGQINRETQDIHILSGEIKNLPHDDWEILKAAICTGKPHNGEIIKQIKDRSYTISLFPSQKLP